MRYLTGRVGLADETVAMSSTASIVKITSADGTELACERSGSGPNLVIVNGALSDRGSADGLRPHLDPFVTVIAYDRRGRGDSGNADRYAPEREMEDLAAVLEASGGPALVFGQSSGGMLALEAALRGVPVSHLAINEPPYIVGDSRRRPSPDLAERLRRLVDSGDREAATHLFLRDSVDLSEEGIAALRSGPGWPRMLGLAHTLAYDALVSGQCELPASERRAEFRTPTLVLRGGASLPWIRLGAEVLAASLPNGRLTDLPGQQHNPAPDALAAALLAFLVS
jgi:pimeloyl-ACP methyl ester carboxylesterase